MLVCLDACHNGTNNEAGQEAATQAVSNVQVPSFNADSAYAYAATQVGFGPRIPNSPSQEKCAAWLISRMQSWADSVTVQRTTVTGDQQKQYRCINIIAHFNPQAKTRTLLLAHWDTRPTADGDSSTRNKTFDGADDGASGVAVLLEAARQLHQQKPAIGVDMLLTDVEDAGVEGNDNSWGLGTQYWSRQAKAAGYRAQYGILLDMVGGAGSHFYMESTTRQYAGAQAKMVWDQANTIGYSDYFRYDNLNGTGITDDHVFVNQLLGVPTLDIVALRPNQPDGNIFPPWHHTINDNMKIIDKNTLKAVGQTVLQVIYTNPAY